MKSTSVGACVVACLAGIAATGTASAASDAWKRQHVAYCMPTDSGMVFNLSMWGGMAGDYGWPIDTVFRCPYNDDFELPHEEVSEILVDVRCGSMYCSARANACAMEWSTDSIDCGSETFSTASGGQMDVLSLDTDKWYDNPDWFAYITYQSGWDTEVLGFQMRD